MSRIMMFLAFLTVMPSAAYASGASSCSEEIERGVASWYGPGFEGAQTQSEEPFNPYGLSAAHPTLPFGTVLKVTNMRNYKSVFVRVNDRGGFSSERVIDISQGAALELDMIDDGTAPVAIFRCND